MPQTVNREQALAVLCDLAFTVGGEVSVAPLLTRTLQRFLYHTGFPAGLMVTTGGVAEVVIGDFRLAGHQGERIELPATLLPPKAALVNDTQALAALDCSVPLGVALALPVPGYGHMLLIALQPPATLLPLTTLFEPVLARLGTAVTLCRQYERQTESRRRILTEAIEQSPVSIVITDADGAIEYVNATFCTNTGYRADEVIGENPRLLQGGDKTPEEYRALWQTIKRGEIWHGEFHNRRKDGSFYWETAVIAPVRDMDGAIAHFVGVKEDITEKKAREAELHRLVEHLTEANTELERFAYVASHDLREPLRTIASFTQLLERRYLGKIDPEADELIGLVVNGAKRMDALINDLLAFSRVASKGTPFAVVDTERACRLAMENLRDSIAEAGATVIVAPLPQVIGDEVQLMQLFQNLIGNAVKYRAPGRVARVSISWARDGKAWRFSITDNGIGIEAQYFDRIFRIFQRLHTADQYDGTGIGLAICKKIVERHGGQIELRSIEGEGSTFAFTLPAVP